MVRSSQATSLTFSSSPYFDDRGSHGTAEPITERVNVCSYEEIIAFLPLTTVITAPFAPGGLLLFSKRCLRTALWRA